MSERISRRAVVQYVDRGIGGLRFRHLVPEALRYMERD
jgi:hypothetical protein